MTVIITYFITYIKLLLQFVIFITITCDIMLLSYLSLKKKIRKINYKRKKN